jgi:ubiquinone/menaquinone biosynthesis C-methylase UbiE
LALKSLMMRFVKRCVELRSIIKRPSSTNEYWEQRAKQYGKLSVLNIGHSDAEIESVTRMQKEAIFPVLKQQLKGDEKTALDFGCGTGRFTSDLAELIQGHAIGVDPIQRLIDLAPKHEKVEYRLIQNGTIPVQRESIDIVWICLVLGGIVDQNQLLNTLSEINRIMKTDGLVFLIENTTNKKDNWHWNYRSVQTYQGLFDFVELKHLSDYIDLGERITIMSGRKSKARRTN